MRIKMDKAAYGFIAGLFLILALYFLYHKPELDKEFNRGKVSCESQVDSIYIPGDTVYLKQDTVFIASKKDTVITHSDNTLSTRFDSIFVSNGDIIGVFAKVKIEDSIANWLVNVTHRDLVKHTVDTLKVFYPKPYEVIIDNTKSLYEHWEFWLMTIFAIIGVVF
jgi:sulfur transfer complex TusBCD TusB component (DsrH family)